MAAATLVAAIAVVGTAPVGAKGTGAFCSAYEKLQLDPTNAKVIKKQAARMAKAKPPRDIVQALGVIKSAAAGDIAPTDARAVQATSSLATYVGEECSAAGPTSSGKGSATTSRCPLTEQQVSSAVGTPLVLDAASCTFFPADDAFPNVTFVRQVAFACNGSIPEEAGYTERLDGLGVKAYVQNTTGNASILVCTEPPFEIAVDTVGDSAGARAAAQQLASQVLQGS